MLLEVLLLAGLGLLLTLLGLLLLGLGLLFLGLGLLLADSTNRRLDLCMGRLRGQISLCGQVKVLGKS